ncbi:MAG: AEC family transporter [Pseudomonadota bacterium]
MLTNLLTTLPIFALILAGWAARRSEALGATATREVNRLVVYLALPALLFDIMANTSPEEIWQPGFIMAFSAGAAAVFVATVLIRIRQGKHLPDAAIDALNASYPNTGYMGIPLILAVVGPEGVAVTLVSIILTVCVLFGFAIGLIEAGLQAEGAKRNVIGKTLLALGRNPLILAPALGAVVMLTGLPIPDPAQRFLSLLGAAASPCALIALGLFLADSAAEARSYSKATVTWLSGLKLFVQPALTWLFAAKVLGLSPGLTHTVVLLSALPTGTGPFMLAQFYDREAMITSRVVLFTTIISVATLSAYLSAIG